jgi:hypothetical protein
MSNSSFKLGQQIHIDKSFEVSIGVSNKGNVAIISNSTNNFVKLKQAKVSKRLRKVKRNLGRNINNDTTFNFEHMSSDDTQQLIDILKKG